jgi:hypothetical protein
MQPKIGNLAKAALGFVASIGGELLLFVASLAVAGIMMAFGDSGAGAVRAILRESRRWAVRARFMDLSTATIRASRRCV